MYKRKNIKYKNCSKKNNNKFDYVSQIYKKYK